MTSVPYPTFFDQIPVNTQESRTALSSVGRCRIFPDRYPQYNDVFRSIVMKSIQHAAVDLDVDDSDQRNFNKKLKKKYMKEGVALAKSFLEDTLHLDVSIVDVECYIEPNDIIQTDGGIAACFLDAGCHAIMTDGSDFRALDVAKIPSNRLVAHFLSIPADLAIVENASTLSSTISIAIFPKEDHYIEDVKTVLELRDHVPKDLDLQIVLQANLAELQTSDEENVATMISNMVKVCNQSNAVISLEDPNAYILGSVYAACVKSDRLDGLFTTVVCSRSGEALGLVYSSKESIIASLECGRGVYYSRSRKGLWRKGDTSGHFQVLHRLDLDCDGDAIRFTVTQKGDDVAAFCHLNTFTCWGQPRGIRHLEATLNDRLKSAPEGSYTKRLFDDATLLRDKLVEEAQELSEATDKKHVAEELADVLYFAMTRAVKAGVSIDDAIEELDRRTRKVTRRQGDSKAFRVELGNSILKKNDPS